MQKAPQKVYIIDNGFVTAQAFNLSDNYGRLLENQVFIELLRRAYNTEQTLFYYMSRNGKEVDFYQSFRFEKLDLTEVHYRATRDKGITPTILQNI